MENIKRPKVVVWVKRLAMSCKHYWYINVTPSDISAHGFQMNIYTWGAVKCSLRMCANSRDRNGLLSGVAGGGIPGSVR